MRKAHTKQRHGLLGPLVAIISLVLVDQVTKWLIVEHVFRPEQYDTALSFWTWLVSAGEQIGTTYLEVLPFFNLVMVWNTGVSFGMLQSLGPNAPLILSGLAGLVAIGMMFWLYFAENKILVAGLTLVIAGAIGNIWDRVRFGAVIDFLDFHAFDYHWPAFNIADSAITIGVILIIIESLLYNRDVSEMNEVRDDDTL